MPWKRTGISRTSKSSGFPELETCQVVAGIVHRLVQNPGGIKRVCAHCKRQGNKFACGMFRRSYYRCEECQVSFCRPNFKDCFQQWHLQLELDNMEKNIENNDHFDRSALF